MARPNGLFMAAVSGALFLAAAPLPPASSPAIVPPVAPVKGKLGTPLRLFNGKDTSGWVWHGLIADSKMEVTWTVRDGILHCAAVKSNATGYIATEKDYRNFILTVEYRHLTAANGGIFVCIAGTAKIWPDSIQVQGNFGHVGDLINQNTGMKHMTTDPARTRAVNKDIVTTRLTPPPGKVAENPLGEWNTLVITVADGNLSVANNGVLLNTAGGVVPDAGKIGLQAEGAEMEYRKIELVPIE